MQFIHTPAVTTASLIASSTLKTTGSDSATRHRQQDCARCLAEEHRRSRARRQSVVSPTGVAAADSVFLKEIVTPRGVDYQSVRVCPMAHAH
jgi:hypothetical protein